MKVNNFTVIGDEYNTNKNVMVPVMCVCGNKYDMPRWSLLNKCPNVCIECRKIEVQDSVDPIRNKLKDIHTKMHQRIANPVGKNSCYVGISIDPEWKDNFDAFYSWSMENGYTPGLTIDREDSAKNYGPSNCRWATTIEQSQNRGKTKNNTTGYKSVYKAKPRSGKVLYENTYKNPYYTIIIYDGKRTTLSGFATAEDAYNARLTYIDEHYKGLVVP